MRCLSETEKKGLGIVAILIPAAIITLIFGEAGERFVNIALGCLIAPGGVVCGYLGWATFRLPNAFRVAPLATCIEGGGLILAGTGVVFFATCLIKGII